MSTLDQVRLAILDIKVPNLSITIFIYNRSEIIAFNAPQLIKFSENKC